MVKLRTHKFYLNLASFKYISQQNCQSLTDPGASSVHSQLSANLTVLVCVFLYVHLFQNFRNQNSYRFSHWEIYIEFYVNQSAEFGKCTLKNFLLNSHAHLRVGEKVSPWLVPSKKILKIWSPRLPEMVFTVPHSSRLYKVVPSPHKMSTCSKLFACHGKILLIFLSTSFAHII